MTEVRSFTVGATAEKSVSITCEGCGLVYEVTLRAMGSVTGEAEARDDPELKARAEAAAREKLDRMVPIQPCPRCGLHQESMVNQLFSDPAHAGARRAFDDSYRAVNSPYARARKLQDRGANRAEIERALADEVERHPALWDLIKALDEDPKLRDAATGSEGERLVAHLKLHRLSDLEIEQLLVQLYGIEERKAEELVQRVAREQERQRGSKGFFVAGGLLVGLGAIVTLVVTFVLPIFQVEVEKKPPETPTPEAHKRTWDTFTAWDDGYGLEASIALARGADADRLILVSEKRADGSRFGRVLINGHAVTEGEWRGEGGDAKLVLNHFSENFPEIITRGEPARLKIMAEIYDASDQVVFKEDRRLVQTAFEVRIPETYSGSEELSDEDVIVLAGPEEDPVPGLILEAMGEDAFDRIDAALFGSPSDAPPAAGEVLSDMDRDIRRAALKERAYEMLTRLGQGQPEQILDYVTDEDRAMVRQTLAWLGSHDTRFYNARFDKATVGISGLTGGVACAFSLDHPAGLLQREGTASWAWRDEEWWFDPVPDNHVAPPPDRESAHQPGT